MCNYDLQCNPAIVQDIYSLAYSRMHFLTGATTNNAPEGMFIPGKDSSVHSCVGEKPNCLFSFRIKTHTHNSLLSRVALPSIMTLAVSVHPSRSPRHQPVLTVDTLAGHSDSYGEIHTIVSLRRRIHQSTKSQTDVVPLLGLKSHSPCYPKSNVWLRG